MQDRVRNQLVQMMENMNKQSTKNETMTAPKMSKSKIQQVESNDLNSEVNSAPISHTFTQSQDATIGEASSNYLVIEMPSSTSDQQKKQSLVTVNEKEQINEKSESVSAVQTQVLNIAKPEPKGNSLNQNKAIVQSTQSLVAKDL